MTDPPQEMRLQEMRLQAMRWWHLPQIEELEQALFHPEAWSPRVFWSELAQTDTRHYLVALDGDEVVGYAGLCAYPDEGYVQTLGVRGDRQGRGTGAALLLALLHESVRRGLDRVLLEVRADNHPAQRLYARFGFTTVGVRKGYYQPSDTDALVLALSGVAARLAATP